MKRYASLIRKLVDATAETETAGTDVADILKNRCFNDTSLIRQILMNAVCDPRFKINADVVGYWKDEARHALEQLAGQLERTPSLTDETANHMLDGFLNAWLRMTFTEVKRPKTTRTDYFRMSSQKEVKDLEDGIEVLDEICKAFPQPSQTDNENKEETGQEQETEQEFDQEHQRDHKDKPRRPRVGNASEQMIRLEERFLQRIPASLVELARRIGRMGNEDKYTAGKFLSAGKSDIAGITIGNDISAVLPSELALLAEKRTQSVFYHNFTARRLQLFASASQSKSPEKHQDGPVIVCVDTSGSMIGESMLVAKVLAVAVAIIAWRRKRSVIVVKYSDTYDYVELGNNRSKLGELIRFFSYVNSGGNNENEMFHWLFKNIKPAYEEYDNADILCVSDFGWTPLTSETERIIQKQKDKGMRFYGLNVGIHIPFADNLLIDELGNSPMDICDSVWDYEDGECKERNKS